MVFARIPATGLALGGTISPGDSAAGFNKVDPEILPIPSAAQGGLDSACLHHLWNHAAGIDFCA